MKSRREFIMNMTFAAGSFAFAPFLTSMNSCSEKNTNPNTKEFLEACSQGNIVKVRELLKNNKELLNIIDESGRSGFVLGLLEGHKNIGDFLKQSGYKIDLHEAALSTDWESYDRILGEESEVTKDKINAFHPMGGNVMWAAAAGGAGKDMWRIYAKCGNPNLSHSKINGSTPLQKALRYSNLAIAEVTAAAILSNNANPNPTPNLDKPPLHIATERGSYEMTEMLIRLGADIQSKDKDGKTPIELAEMEGHENIFNLINNQRSIPRTSHTSRTAFNRDGNFYKIPDINDIPLFIRRRFVGKSHGDFEYVKKEVNKDSRLVHSVATTSEICVEACAHIGNKKIAEFLVENGAPYSLPTAIMLNDFTTVKKLLNEDPNRIHERGAHDFALLWYSIIGQCGTDMTQLLLDRGAKVEEQHFLGTTALHWACQRGPIEQVELLVENGANVNRIGRKFEAKGETPIQSANDEKTKKYLISKGAK